MPARVPEQVESVRLSLTRGLLLSLAIFAVLAALWSVLIRPYYFPHADNFALLANSCPPFHPSYADWLLKGFRNYLYVYPDLSSHSSNFIRPMVNLTFFVNWVLFRSHWAAYLLANYLIIALLAGVAYFIAAQPLKLGWKLSTVVALCVAVAPSIDTAALLDPTFAFDLLCGLMVLCAVLALITDSLVACWIFLMLAIFTKEAALFAVPLAATILFLRFDALRIGKRLAVGLVFLLPLAAWQGFRWFDYRGERGLYVMMNRSSHGFVRTMLVRVYEGMLTWPLAVQVWNDESHLQKLIERMAVFLNLAFWLVAAVLLCMGLLKLGTALRSGKFRIAGENYPAIVVVAFCAGSLVMPLILNLPRRFGGVFFPLFFLSLSLCIAHAPSLGWKRVAALLMLITAACGAYLIAIGFAKQVRPAKNSWALARSYVAALSSIQEPVVFSLDDAVAGYSSNPYVKIFANYSGDLVRIDDLHLNFICGGQLQVNASVDLQGAIRLDSHFPGHCGGYGFDSLFPPLEPGLSQMTRTLPEGTLQYRFAGTSDDKELRIAIAPGTNSGAILYPDFKTFTYKVIHFDGAGNHTVLR